MITNLDEFANSVMLLKKVISIQGKVYTITRVRNGYIYFIRSHKDGEEKIDLKELFELYQDKGEINTSLAKSFITGRVQSPSVAIIKSLRNQNEVILEGSNLFQHSIINKSNINLQFPKITNDKDETKFFHVLAEIVGFDNLRSKSIGKSISSSDIFLNSDYRTYGFEDELNRIFEGLLKDLLSDLEFKNSGLECHIDGIITNPITNKKRIVEFDEEQHFTPARSITIKHLRKIIDNPYLPIYESICTNRNYFPKVLKKNRIKKVFSLPDTYQDFLIQLESENSSGYIEPKNGFDYKGGRIAQRAYYDCLRDVAHLSPLNQNFEPPIRFAQKTFEDKAGRPFKQISINEIKGFIREILKDLYSINF